MLPLSVHPINALLSAAITTLCLALAWMVVFIWRIGPVIATIDSSAGHGIHSGDLLALPLVALGALVHDGLIGHPSR